MDTYDGILHTINDNIFDLHEKSWLRLIPQKHGKEERGNGCLAYIDYAFN